MGEEQSMTVDNKYQKEMKLKMVTNELASVNLIIDNHREIKNMSNYRKNEFKHRITDKRRLRRLLTSVNKLTHITEFMIKNEVRKYIELLYIQYKQEEKKALKELMVQEKASFIDNYIKDTNNTNILDIWGLDYLKEYMEIPEMKDIRESFKNNVLSYATLNDAYTHYKNSVYKLINNDFNMYVFYTTTSVGLGIGLYQPLEDFMKHRVMIKEYINFGSEAFHELLNHLYNGEELKHTLEELQEKQRIAIEKKNKEREEAKRKEEEEVQNRLKEIIQGSKHDIDELEYLEQYENDDNDYDIFGHMDEDEEEEIVETNEIETTYQSDDEEQAEPVKKKKPVRKKKVIRKKKPVRKRKPVQENESKLVDEKPVEDNDYVEVQEPELDKPSTKQEPVKDTEPVKDKEPVKDTEPEKVNEPIKEVIIDEEPEIVIPECDNGQTVKGDESISLNDIFSDMGDSLDDEDEFDYDTPLFKGVRVNSVSSSSTNNGSSTSDSLKNITNDITDLNEIKETKIENIDVNVSDLDTSVLDNVKNTEYNYSLTEVNDYDNIFNEPLNEVVTEEDNEIDIMKEKLMNAFVTIYSNIAENGGNTKEDITSYKAIRSYVSLNARLNYMESNDDSLYVKFSVGDDVYIASPFFLLCENPFKLYYDTTNLLTLNAKEVVVPTEFSIKDEILHIVMELVMRKQTLHQDIQNSTVTQRASKILTLGQTRKEVLSELGVTIFYHLNRVEIMFQNKSTVSGFLFYNGNVVNVTTNEVIFNENSHKLTDYKEIVKANSQYLTSEQEQLLSLLL